MRSCRHLWRDFQFSGQEAEILQRQAPRSSGRGNKYRRISRDHQIVSRFTEIRGSFQGVILSPPGAGPNRQGGYLATSAIFPGHLYKSLGDAQARSKRGWAAHVWPAKVDHGKFGPSPSSFLYTIQTITGQTSGDNVAPPSEVAKNQFVCLTKKQTKYRPSMSQLRTH